MFKVFYQPLLACGTVTLILHDVNEDITDYNKGFNDHGESPKALQWTSYKSAAIRYRQLVNDLELGNKSILDAGCGMGDLLPYIYAKTANFQYLGVDVTPEFIDIAKKRYHGHEFQVADPFSDEFTERFDVVVSSGVLNANKPSWLEERKQRIQKLYVIADEVLAFNMAGGLAPLPEGKKVAYARALDILNFCISLTPKIIFKSHYHRKDFTIVMFK